METNNHKISDYSAVLAEKYGAVDSPERNQFNEEAYAFYTGQILKDARKEAMTKGKDIAQKTVILACGSLSYLGEVQRIVLNNRQ